MGFADWFRCAPNAAVQAWLVLVGSRTGAQRAQFTRLTAGLRRRETPQEQVRRWQRVIRTEMRAVDRQVAGA